MSTELQNGQGESWEAREQAFLKKIAELELKQGQDKQKIATLENETKTLQDEKANLILTTQQLEKNVVEARKSQNLVDSQEVQVIKEQSEELLIKAKGIIFEKTKVCQNQELQIEALGQQVTSLKEVLSITKELLEIRNIEVRHLQERLDGMEVKFKLDREKQELMNKKMERMVLMNTELKREYETQLCLFNALRERYSERELARGVIDEARQAENNANAENNPENNTNNEQN